MMSGWAKERNENGDKWATRNKKWLRCKKGREDKACFREKLFLEVK